MLTLYLDLQTHGIFVKSVGKTGRVNLFLYRIGVELVLESRIDLKLELIAFEPGAHRMELLDAAAFWILFTIEAADKQVVLFLFFDLTNGTCLFI